MKDSRKWVFAIIGIILMAVVMPQLHMMASQDLTAESAQPKLRISNYDIRDESGEQAEAIRQRYGVRLNSAQSNKKAQLALTMQKAKETLGAQIPGLEVKFSNSGAAEIVGVEPGRKKLLTSRSSAESENIVRDFVGRNAGLYGLTSKQIAQLKKVADYTNPAGNLSWVELQQEINGLPVFQGNLLAALTRKGELLRTVGRLAPVLEDGKGSPLAQSFELESADASSSAIGAVISAAAMVGVAINESDLVLKEASADGTSFTFEPGPFASDITVEALYFPLEQGVVTRAWSMVLWQDVPAYYTLVDAETGGLLWRKNITEEQTQPATYSIYNDDSPAPLSPSNALPGNNTQGVAIPRTTLTLISELPAFDNLGWLTDGATTTTGNNVDAGLDIAAPNGIDVGGRPVSPTRTFVYDFNPAPGLGGAPGSNSPTDANYRSGAVTSIFFWANRYHDRLYQLGFTEAARNFQQDNFGRNPTGGTANARNGNDRVLAEAQDSSGTNNANFSTPADGSSGRMQMYIWPNTTPQRDGDLDLEIVLHELTHGTSNRLHANASGLSSKISRGMGEGWSDFYARSLLSSADEDVDGVYAMAAYTTHLATTGYTNNYYNGIRRFPYAVKTNVGPNGKPHNPLTLADTNPNAIDLTDGAFPRGPFGAGGRSGALAVHNIGEVWCMSLLEVRSRLIKRLGYNVGNQRMLQLVTDAMKLDPVAPTLIDSRNSLLTADASFGNEDLLDIWAGFATRGIGFGATMSTTNANGKESFDYPIPGMGTTSFTEAACNADGKADVGEDLTLTIPLTNPLNVAITDVSASVVGGGSANYGTINPGQTVNQNISYQVPANVACGSTVTVSVNVTSSLGMETKTFTINTGMPVLSTIQNFDGVIAPALPAGWVSGGTPAWTTTTTASDTAPNSATVAFQATTATSQLTSPSIAIPPTGTTQVTFRHSYNSEFEWDGGILAISINGGGFFDILDAGGSFVTGGYPFALITSADGNTNSLQNRAAWTGNSGGFITTTVNLPASAAGQSVRLAFFAGSDSSTTPTGAHWRIDSISFITSYACASVATSTTSVTATPVQYSDQTTLSATVGSACAHPTGSVQFSVNGSPVGSATVSGPGTVTLDVQINLAAGSYPVTANFISSNPYYQNSSGSGSVSVSRENATVTPSGSNPSAVKVNSPGGTAGPITLAVAINEVSDGSPGNISNAVPVTFTLTPVGPGSPYTQIVNSGSGGGVGGTLNVSATFTNVAVNVYDVSITIGGDYYTGSGSTVLAVYDPSLGFVTGGGTIIRNGVVANFGFNIKYLKNGNAQGQFLYIEHQPSGDVKLKSNALQSLSIAGNTGIVLGKATLNDVGNHSFRATVVDNGEPGASDQFGLQVTSPGGSIISGMTFAPITLSGGNIQVPRN